MSDKNTAAPEVKSPDAALTGAVATIEDTNELEDAGFESSSKEPEVFSMKAAKAVAKREEKPTKVLLNNEFREPLMTTDAEGKPTRAFAMVVGKLSQTYRDAELEVNDTVLKRRLTELTALTLEQQELTKLAACVKSWNLRDGKTPIECTRHNVIMVMMAASWIRRDLDTAAGDPARFL